MNIILFVLSPVLYAIVLALLWTAWHYDWKRVARTGQSMVPHDCQPEWWQGYCWDMTQSRSSRCAPIGINLIMRLSRAIWCWARHPIRFFDAAFEVRTLKQQMKRERRDMITTMDAHYDHGYKCGHSDGVSEAIADSIETDVFPSNTTYGMATGAYGVQMTLQRNVVRAWDQSPELRDAVCREITRSVDGAVKRMKNEH